jgi:LmbE family N-acetylglucosaminyl deacetylase
MTEAADSIFRIAAKESQPGLRLLLLGAHPDDIEIGCGATILRLVEERLIAEAWWVVFSGEGPRAEEAKDGAQAFLSDVGASRVIISDHRDGFYPLAGVAIKEEFEALKADFRPDLVFTHRTGDRHQDHRFIGEITWQTFRECPILEYEIPKYDGDLGSPNLYVRVPDRIARRKIDLLTDIYRTQVERPWFTAETFLSVLRLRGIECRADSGYAEGFEARKTIL